MFTTSDNYKKIMQCPTGRDFHGKAHIAFTGGTAIDVDDRNIMASDGIQIDDAVSDSNKFQIGGAVIGELTLVLNNYEGTFKNYNFKGAVITPYIGLTTAVSWKDGKIIEWVPKGVFNVNDSPAIGSQISVSAYDNMSKMDVAYSKSTLKYPATLGQIAADVCSVCGVTLATTTFPNSTYSVASRPSESSTTCREILSYVAQLAGCFARCNRDGAVEIRWYTEGDTLYDVGNNASSYSVADSDTKITGVQIEGNDDANTIYSSGADGYIARIKDNPLAQDNLQTIADALGAKFNGYTFRSFSVSSPNNPAIEAGDIVNMTDKAGITHKTFVSHAQYEFGENETYNADAETTDENQSERFSAAEKAQEAADTAQQSADKANDAIVLVDKKVGDVESRVTATETGLESKVNKDELSTDIQQNPDAVVAAFNTKDGSTQTVKFTGNGFDFYNNGTYIGHMGINGNHLDFTLGDGVSIQWNADSGYAMQWYPHDQTDGQEGGFHTGNFYPKYINMKGGNVMNVGTVQCANLDADGIVGGVSHDVVVKGSDGSNVGLSFKNGVFSGTY